MEAKQKSTAQWQPQQQTPLAQDHRLLLIRNVSKYPSLYKNEFLRTPFLHRHEKQHMWDKIAQDSGLEKSEDAKCKWRSLINYLRQHLYNVANKKTRRYIPISDNPEDKYVQLTDWCYYSELEFVVPYVKYAASKQCNNAENRTEISPSEIDLIIEGIEAEVEKKNEEVKRQTSENNHNQQQQEQKEEQQNIKDKKLISFANIDNLTENDEILKEYFENMLKSALKLPRFHQNVIKQKLLECVNEQKALNKII